MKKCPKCSSVLWPSITSDYMHLCPKCNEEYSDEDGVLKRTDGRWLM